MVQSLLADRFKLQVTHGTKELPVYALVVAKNGPKLTLSKVEPPGLTPKIGYAMRIGRGQLTATGISMGEFVEPLSKQMDLDDRKVLDQTGLTGAYDIALKWTPDQDPAAMLTGPEGGKPATNTPPPPGSSGPSIFTAL